MSDLPEIDHSKVAQRLSTKNAEQYFQIVQLEVLAEAIRDERDSARNERDDLSRRLADALAPTTDVQNISSLPVEG